MFSLGLVLVFFGPLLIEGRINQSKNYLPRYWPPWESAPESKQSTWEAAFESNPRLERYLRYPFIKFEVDEKCYDHWKKNGVRKVIPIYFWTGDTIEIPCVFCFKYRNVTHKKRWGTSSPKMWRILPGKEILDNVVYLRLEEERKWVTLGKWEQQIIKDGKANLFPPRLQGLPEGEPDVRPYFLQQDGKLIILRATADVQGIYNCYDKDFPQDFTIIYVVIAMTPYAHLSSQPRDTLLPHWKWHYYPLLINTKTNDGSKGDNPFKTNPENDKGFIKSVDLGNDSNVHLWFKWSPWGVCSHCSFRQGRRFREGHCYLRKKHVFSRIVSDKAWLKNLELILSMDPFNVMGVRLHSGFLSLALQQERFDERATQPWRDILDILERSSHREADFCFHKNDKSIIGGYFYQAQNCECEHQKHKEI